MRKIGVLIRNLALNNQAYDLFKVVERLNKEDRHDINLNVFVVELDNRKIFLRCPIFSMSEIYGFNGECISIGSEMLEFSLNNLSCSTNHLYIPEMEWLHSNNYSYQNLFEKYNSELIKDIYMDSEMYAEFFENNFNRKVKVANSFEDIVWKILTNKK